MKIILGHDIGLNLAGRAGDASTRQAKPISWHAHDAFELLFVFDGEVSYEFKNHPSLHIPGGSFLVIPPGLRHRGLDNIRTPATLFGITCKPQADHAAQLTSLTPADLVEIQRVLKEAALIVRSCGRELHLSLMRLSQLVNRHAEQRLTTLIKAKLRAAICTVIIDAVVHLGSAPEPDVNAIVAAATAYIELRSAEPLQISDLVRHLGFSRARVFELFRAGTGMTPNDYLQRCRVRKARKLLIHSALSVTEVALDAGFSSSQYFSQVFKKYTGMTPSRYRAGQK
ncbi:MAG: AraC family transcriptional regulator [Kiritimatiellae bacterium]|nr:AraC family transcriptional regulator [Kiritimatiellia bacterium]